MDDFLDRSVTYQFAEFEFCVATEQFFINQERVKIEPQLCSFLLLLLSNRGELVSRQQIQDQVWAGRLVTDEAIRAAIKKLRELLKDDARAPKYIKTLPKQGYKWVAPVSVSSSRNNDDSHQAKVVFWKRWGAVVCTLGVIVLLGYVNWIPEQQVSQESVPSPQLTPLTSLSGSETFADYHMASNKLVFLHRQANHSPQQLYIKSLDTGEIKRLSWDEASYSNTYWSNDGLHLAFDRLHGGQKTLHIADFDQQGNLQQVRLIEHPHLAGKFVIGWLHDQSGLLLAEEMRHGRQQGIFRYEFKDNVVQAISAPNVAGRGDYLAAQSFDGNKLAILREVSSGQMSLLIMESSTGRMLANKTLPFVASRMVWQFDDEAVLLTSFFGQASRYVLATDFFDPYPPLPENSMDIFASCGQRCYILRQHNGDFLDIEEVPLEPSSTTAPILQSGRLFKMPGAQDMARYTGQGDELVYVSLIDQAFVFQHVGADNQLNEIGRLNRTHQLTNLAVSQDSLQLAGIANGRLFLLSTAAEQSNQPQFLTNALERFDNPVWHSNNQHLYVTHFGGNVPSIVLYDTHANSYQKILENMVGFKPVEGVENTAIAIDLKGNAWQVIKTETGWQKDQRLGEIPSHNHHRWALHKGRLYYSQATGRDAKLCSFAIAHRGENPSACRDIGQNRFRLNFDIHPRSNKVLLVESLSAQSDIVRLSW